MNSNSKLSSFYRENGKRKDLVKNNSSNDFLLDRKNSNLTINNLNNSNSNINSVNNSTNLVSISTSSHLKPAKIIKANNKKNNIFQENTEERKSKEIVLKDFNLSSKNFCNENLSKKETTNNNFTIPNNNNQNITSNNFNTIISNSNCNYSEVITKESKVNPNYDKCKYSLIIIFRLQTSIGEKRVFRENHSEFAQ